MTGELILREELSGDFVRISIIGEIDIYSAQKFKEQLYKVIESNNTDLRINCKELHYIDSTGLGVFVGALKKVKQFGKDVYLDEMKENIKKLFIITGLDKLFIIE